MSADRIHPPSGGRRPDPPATTATKKLDLIARDAAGALVAFISEGRRDILEAWDGVIDEARAQEQTPTLRLGFSIALNLDKQTAEFALVWGVRRKLTTSRPIPDPNQPELPLRAEDSGPEPQETEERRRDDTSADARARIAAAAKARWARYTAARGGGSAESTQPTEGANEDQVNLMVGTDSRTNSFRSALEAADLPTLRATLAKLAPRSKVRKLVNQRIAALLAEPESAPAGQ